MHESMFESPAKCRERSRAHSAQCSDPECPHDLLVGDRPDIAADRVHVYNALMLHGLFMYACAGKEAHMLHDVDER
jgi:hypothetical protein